ncbi:hypothetical protein B9Z55_000845 [Caenorhabditis nigoni]|uniref:Uncharacterized protein n=1 Tax=Caenorhabditis nigoni TaxID=1611254 RepID=A0A2G5VV32_9PELO|nr:hypothetical protein B9Z55_000845 [Caenorhabditis nigoni]
MKRKVTHDTRTVFSGSDIKTEVTKDETPVRKKAKNNRQGSSCDTISMEFTEAETPKKIKKIANKRKKAKRSENDSSSIYLTSVTPMGVPSMYLERSESPSLWISLPRADQSQLLTFVLGVKLIQSLPKRFKAFLNDWLSSVQQQMIQMLKDDGLRKTIESLMSKGQKTLGQFDEKLCCFLEKVMREVLQTERFPIFEGEQTWINFLRTFVRKVSLTENIDATKMEMVATQLGKPARSAVNSRFPGSKGNKSNEAKICYYRILRFALKFALNTLRHVFKFHSESCCFSYCGELEEDLIPAIGAPSLYLERNELSSFWITVPRADQSQLLKFVLSDKMIRIAPDRFKEFLTNWIVSVQHRMIETLRNDGLRNTIESLIKCQESLKRSDERLCFFLEKVMRDVFETKQFAIFEGERVWIDFTRSFVKDMSLTEKFEKTKLKIVSTQLNECAQRKVISLFSGSNKRRNKQAQMYFYHILRFALMFALNTLRHVFKFDSKNSTFFYDGELEEEERSEWEKVTDSIDLISVIPFGVPSMYLERNQHPSLWITFPQSKQSHLLEFVLEDELIRVTPEPFKAFLTDWLLSVQQQMIQFLKDDGLRNIGLVKVQAPKTLGRCDGRPRILVERTLNAVFQTKQFPIFEGGKQWMKFIRKFIQTGLWTHPPDETELKLTSRQVNKNARIAVSSFFRETDETKESKEQRKQRYKTEQIYYYRILRFALKFALNTLRHVFKFDSENSTFFYDGELEEGGISYQTSDWENVAEERDVKPQVVPFTAPTTNGSTSSTISKNPTTTASFGPPSMHVAEEHDVKPQLPLAVPLEAPVQKPQGHLPPKDIVPTVPPPNVPSSSNIDDKMSQYMQFFDSSLVPQKWLNAFKMVVQHNEYLKSQEARLEARYKELKAEVQEMKEEKRRRMI